MFGSTFQLSPHASRSLYLPPSVCVCVCVCVSACVCDSANSLTSCARDTCPNCRWNQMGSAPILWWSNATTWRKVDGSVSALYVLCTVRISTAYCRRTCTKHLHMRIVHTYCAEQIQKDSHGGATAATPRVRLVYISISPYNWCCVISMSWGTTCRLRLGSAKR